MNHLKMKTFCGQKCTVTPHSTLNISKGVVRCPALNKQSTEHILEFMAEQGVTDVRRYNNSEYDQEIPHSKTADKPMAPQ